MSKRKAGAEPVETVGEAGDKEKCDETRPEKKLKTEVPGVTAQVVHHIKHVSATQMPPKSKKTFQRSLKSRFANSMSTIGRSDASTLQMLLSPRTSEAFNNLVQPRGGEQASSSASRAAATSAVGDSVTGGSGRPPPSLNSIFEDLDSGDDGRRDSVIEHEQPAAAAAAGGQQLQVPQPQRKQALSVLTAADESPSASDADSASQPPSSGAPLLSPTSAVANFFAGGGNRTQPNSAPAGHADSAGTNASASVRSSAFECLSWQES